MMGSYPGNELLRGKVADAASDDWERKRDAGGAAAP